MQKTDVNTALAIAFIAVAVVLIGALVVIPAIQEAQARGGPPPKAQAILSTPPSERGAVASGGHGGCGLCG